MCSCGTKPTGPGSSGAGDPATAGNTTAVGTCVQPCPCKPISGISVISVEFLSDHKVLKNDVSNWKNEGSLYPKPDWTTATNHPVSHSMDKPVQLKVTARVDPPEACPETGTWEGTGPNGLAFPPVAGTFQPGIKNSFTVASSSNLPKVVQKLPFAVTWTAKATSGTFTSSSSSYCLVTISDPMDEGVQEDGATTKRMVQAIDFVGPMATIKPHEIVSNLMGKIAYYTLERSPSVPVEYNHPTYFNSVGGAWPISEYIDKYAECQAIVRWVRGIIKQIGCPGEAKGVVVWADPNVGGGATAIESPLGSYTLHGRTKVIGGRTCSVALAATDPGPIGSEWKPRSMMNMYEACLKFTYDGVTKYYGGGAGTFNSKDEVIMVFYALVWYSASPQSDGSIKYRIEEIVHRFK